MILYAAVIWALIQKMEEFLKGDDCKMLRCMVEVIWEDRVTNEEVSERCGVIKLKEKLRTRRLKWS